MFSPARFKTVCLALLVLVPFSANAQPLPDSSHLFVSPFTDSSHSALCEDGICLPAITNVTYFGRPAFRLTNGICEAIVVPSLGRVMSYGKVKGPNLLWNAPTPKGLVWGWKNFGGDKTWLSPQSDWAVTAGKQWPPDLAFDGDPHQAEVVTGGKLKLISGTSKTSGIRIERVMGFNDVGEFEIQQSAIKTAGAPVRVGLWSVSQSVPAQAVFLPTSPDSPYKNGFFRFDADTKDKHPASVTGGVLRIDPQSTGGGQKFGTDAPISALASVRDGVAWVQKSSKPAGQYPDGVEKHGFPVEVYVNGDPKAYYVELEMLGPLVNMTKGQKMTHTVRWSLHELPSHDLADPATHTAIASLLN